MLTNIFPTIDQINKICESVESTIDYLMKNGILESQKMCPNCNNLMRWNPNSSQFSIIRCSNDKCRTSQSIFRGSIFQNSKIPCNIILRIAYFWLLKMKITSIEILEGISLKTSGKYYKKFNLLVESDIFQHAYEKIGGPGIVVEVDESKFGKRKYHRGHHVEGTWIVGGIERTPQKKMFMIAVIDRTSETLSDIIHDHIEQGSIIHTDCWSAYSTAISENNFAYNTQFIHKTVNHSKEFVTEDGVHTNNIESCWNAAKSGMSTHDKSHKCETYLQAHLWRKKNKGNLWQSFLLAIKSQIQNNK